jgi:hypothetical protein
MGARGYRRYAFALRARLRDDSRVLPDNTRPALTRFRVAGTPCCDDRLSSGGRLAFVLLFAWDPVGAGDRAGVFRGCAVPGDRDA